MTANPFSDRIAAFDENYPIILERMERAAEESGRKSGDIKLLAATKTVPVEVINHAVERGVSLLGENRVQEFLEKYDSLNKDKADLQFIGRLQTNKVKYLMDKVSCIQSVDSIRLTGEISRQCVKLGIGMDILVEVNIGGEESKGGVAPERLYEFIDEASRLPGIFVKGLMAIPPETENLSELTNYFSKMSQYYVDIKGKTMDNVSMECLSMGMSSDYPEAIRCGANMVRIGSALFGRREKKGM